MIVTFYLIVAIIFSHSSVEGTNSTSECDISNCNKEGLCYVENNEKRCKCVKDFFTGAKCEQPIKLCMRNLCKNSKKCEDYPGNYYCVCQEGFSGQNCTTNKKNLFKGLHLLYNRIQPVNEKQNFLIIMKEKGSVQCTLEIYSTYYVLQSVAFPTKKNLANFLYSDDLSVVSENLEISSKLPFEEGHYMIIKVSFIQLGEINMKLTVSDIKNGELYFSHHFQVLTYKKPGACFPIIHQLQCESPQEPMQMRIEKSNTIRQIVEKSCGDDSELKFKWTVRNYLDTKTLVPFIGNNTRQLKIPSFTLWFNDQNEDFHLNYIVKVRVSEVNPTTKKTGMAISRCYIQVVMADLIADVEGGKNRRIFVNKAFDLNGSKSRDNSFPENNQKLTFKWSCRSEEVNNYCKNEMGTTKILRIPEKALKINIEYNYTLQVISKTTKLTAYAWQIIEPIEADALQLSIECIRNCAHMAININDNVHKIAQCKNCNEAPINYTWTMLRPKQNVLSTSQRLVIENGQLKPSTIYVIRVNATQEDRAGFTEFEIKTGFGTMGGNCTISPESGQDYHTIFEIKCLNFAKLFGPLTYYLYIEDQLVFSTTDSDFKTRLTAANSPNENCNLLIRATDTYGTSAIVQLNVKLTQSKDLPSSLAGMLKLLNSKDEEFNLKKLVNIGDLPTAAILATTVSKIAESLQNIEDKYEILEEILNSFENCELTAPADIETMTALMKRVISIEHVNHKIAQKAGAIYEKIGNTLIELTKSNEIWEVNQHEFIEITANLTEIVQKAFYPVDTFPLVHNAVLPPISEDPLVEDYPDYGDMDIFILEKTANWLQGTKSMEKLFYGLGVAGGRLFEPLDNVIRIDNSHLFYEFYEHEEINVTDVNFSGPKYDIRLDSNLMESIYDQIDSTSIATQFIAYKKNPFWWYPEQFKITTDVVSLSIFVDNVPLKNDEFPLQKHFELFLSIKDFDEESSAIEIRGFVNASLDMPIYESQTPKGSLTLIKFYEIEDDLRIRIEIGKRPKYREILKDFTRLNASSNSTRYYNNMENENNKIYIGLIPFANLTLLNKTKTEFRFKIFVFSCRHWNSTIGHWTNDHCQVGPLTNFTHIHCRCNHLSTFAGKLFFMPHQLNLPRDVILSLRRNFITLVFLVALVSIFAGLMGWAWFKEKNDSTRRNVIFVGGHNPSDKYRYVVTLSTGIYRYAGTTANISIILHGASQFTESYILCGRSSHMLFTKNSEDTFEIFTTAYLGRLTQITLSHDNTGRYPSWYCKNVRVKDVYRREEFIFIVEMWLSLVYSGSTKAIIVSVATEAQLKNYKYVLREHITRGLRDGYPWYSLLVSHPRSNLSRMEKVMMLFVSISFGGMLNIMFFGRSTEENIEDEREIYSKFIVTLKIMLHSLICAILGMNVSSLLVYLFNKTRNKEIVKYRLIFGNNDTEEGQL